MAAGVTKNTPQSQPAGARPVNSNDFALAMQKVKKTGESAINFGKKEISRGRRERAAMAAGVTKNTPQSQPASIDIRQLMALAASATAAIQLNGKDNSYEIEAEGDDSDPPEIFQDSEG